MTPEIAGCPRLRAERAVRGRIWPIQRPVSPCASLAPGPPAAAVSIGRNSGTLSIDSVAAFDRVAPTPACNFRHGSAADPCHRRVDIRCCHRLVWAQTPIRGPGRGSFRHLDDADRDVRIVAASLRRADEGCLGQALHPVALCPSRLRPRR